MTAPASTCGLDPLPTNLLKEFVDDFVPYVTQLVNASLKSGCFPVLLQHALIKPLLKKPNLDRQCLSNYRPVANLRYVGKVLERIVSIRLQSFISDNSSHDPFQSAYRAGHGVETALLRVMNDVLLAMDGGRITALVLLDLSSAFDTVDHPTLLTRLRQLGLGGTALDWFESYLSKRSQAVHLREATSQTVQLDSSVPQGSVLGPQLFSVYMLPLRHIITKCNLGYHVYADDLQQYISCLPTQENVDWFESYLSKRSQAVHLREATSQTVQLDSSVPQGSVLGPQLFSVYMLPLRHIITKCNLGYHVYADDLQQYISCLPTQENVDSCISQMERCISDIQRWMGESHLKLNESKTEFVLLGSRQQLSKVVVPHIKIGSSLVVPAEKVKNLGAILDPKLSLVHHLSNCVKLANYGLRNLRAIRHFFTLQATQQLVRAFVTSRLDFCNALLYGLPKHLLHRLQKTQNSAARLVVQASWSASINPILKELHWLPINERIVYKILLLTYKSLSGLAPQYLSCHVKYSVPGRVGLRSSTDMKLVEFRMNRSWGDRSFAAAAPRLWNSLPPPIRSCTSISIFKKQLKTPLMGVVFN
ncbi:uncharacterized protein [Asterias amurensis]|uniref:uncharacterized protein n=1 Tax=Asterias amurensis TaxID=7602 RepID=UPI003AB6A9EA